MGEREGGSVYYGDSKNSLPTSALRRICAFGLLFQTLLRFTYLQTFTEPFFAYLCSASAQPLSTRQQASNALDRFLEQRNATTMKTSTALPPCSSQPIRTGISRASFSSSDPHPNLSPLSSISCIPLLFQPCRHRPPSSLVSLSHFVGSLGTSSASRSQRLQIPNTSRKCASSAPS